MRTAQCPHPKYLKIIISLIFTVDGEKLYLLQPQNIYVRENGKIQRIGHLDDPKNMYSGLKNNKGSISAGHHKGSLQCTPAFLNKGIGNEVKVTRSLPASVNIEINGEYHSIYVPEVGSVEYLGAGPDQSHYLYVESIENHVPLKVRRDIYLIDNEANILTILHLPQQKFTYIFKEFIIGDEGELYHMHSAKDGIHIIKWILTKDDVKEISYPGKFSETYHFNDYINAEPELEVLPALAKPAGSVTRAQALITADEYVTHTWSATSSNIGTTSTVTTPGWIQVGQNQRIPYQWGGYSTIAQFDQGVAAGKYAGDINTSVPDLSNAVGADCSGFVSICWTSGRYSTSSFHNVSYELSSFNDLLPADATNKAGSHIRMVVEWTNDGRLVQIEETASGTPGWAARYYTWRLSDITAYVPIRYNNILNSLAPRPTLLSLTNNDRITTLNWSAEESTTFSGYRVYRKGVSDEEYSVVAEIPKGTFTANVSNERYAFYDYFVAAYVESDSANYNASDIYSSMSGHSAAQLLIVDGFDRASGSYGTPTHDFVAQTAEAIGGWAIDISSCANEAVINNDINLNNYSHVWWICGDESTVDETFDDTEQDKVEAYLKQGGKLFVSGSEIGWDLDNKGSTNDKAFIHDYLKVTYVNDDAENYHITGSAGSEFEDIDLYFSENGSEEGTYAEDYPDYFSVSGGSEVVLQYGNSRNAALAFTGTFSGGTAEGQVITMGFPFEVIIGSGDKNALAGKVLEYMGHHLAPGVEEIIPAEFTLSQNYPNPFNPSTAIQYELAEAADINIRIFDMRGREIQRIIQGRQEAGQHKIIFNGTMLPSGMYVYGLELNGVIVESRKMIVNK